MYFYQYLKYESRTNSDKKILKIVGELQKYINTLEKLKQQDRDVLLRSIDTLVDDILNIIKEHENISKEVTTMRLSDSILEEGRQEGRKEGRKEEKKDTIINLYHLGVDVTTISKGVRLTEQEVLDILSEHR